MAGRVAGKVAIVVGGGQTPGETIGNGRATAILLAREGAKVAVADRNLASAEDTVSMIRQEGGEAFAFQVDATSEADIQRLVAATVERYGKLDILHTNVGASIALGDAPADVISEEALDRSFAVNFKSAWLGCKHALPHLRKVGGSITMISSLAARNSYPWIGYKATKTALLALMENLATAEAKHGVRANAILPGAMNTPMAIEPRVAKGVSRDQVIASRDRRVPLGGRMGTGWDTGYAALFLNSDEAKFITGVALVVDGGELVSAGSQGI
jgi:NAD(P)-dependent dehydrogenase (short-subunit alcohol dehydrogenase family)